MGTKIRVLPDEMINQIAAGEVIENPASVVKELVENSLDAGATDICVEIKGGGRQLIRVTDNGCGMSCDDAILCLERHATSKIRNFDDFQSLSTMGFRGEAIPSIASISKFTLITCLASEKKNAQGTMVIVDGGQMIKSAPAARDPGTTVEVKSLFFNVPVRKKFQKSPSYDANEILKTLTILALGHPNVQFELLCDQKNLFSTGPTQGDSFLQQLENRIASLLGWDFAQSLRPIDLEIDSYRFQGYIGDPSAHRHNRSGQYLFINKRAVFSPLISYAVKEGYGPTIPQQRHPVFVLHLSMSGTYVDVNVHPQKREVRLRKEPELKQAIIRAVESALHVPETLAPLSEIDFSFPVIEPVQPKESFELPMRYSETEPEKKAPELAFAPPKAVIRVVTTIPRYILIDPASFVNLTSFPIKGNGGLCVVDQKAAHSRVIFEQWMQTSMLELQMLLVPLTLELSPLEAAFLRETLEEFNRIGFRIREFGPTTFIVEAIPQMLHDVDISAFIQDTIQDLREYNDTNIVQKERERRLARMASRASLSKEKRLSIEEAQALVNQLLRCQAPLQCPLGKPTIIHVSSDDIAKQFSK
jgi:DNA mismatch repair protein MutL